MGPGDKERRAMQSDSNGSATLIRRRTVLDIVCWDLHARMLNTPLHALLGTKRSKVLRCGDMRGTQPDFTPEKYAASVARYFDGPV